MGCGASHDALAHSPVALHHEMGGGGRFSGRSRGLKLPEPEREVEQLVNHVNLGTAWPPSCFFETYDSLAHVC
jgi:hypothetical protein|eukprot:COSAG02_NODE_10354_length_1961_cov_2.634264_2_plen_73_part_00